MSKPSNEGEARTVMEPTVRLAAGAGRILNDHYRLVREVARGGMGVVFEAEDVKLAGRRLAVKLLPPEVAHDRGSIALFEREAAAVCRLDHPNIVRLVEFNSDGELHYIVMDYLEGDDLSLYLARHERLSLDEVLAIGRQVAGALDYAHRAGVLHRDVKPSNLMVKGSGEEQRVVLTDFGIAYQIRGTLTRLGTFDTAGTLLYVSPEQLRGGRPVPASDQYSLAATLYEMLSGTPPFSGPGLSVQILEATPRALDGVPEHVNDTFQRALSKDPEDRFPDCAAFMAALEGEAGAPASTVGSASVPVGFRWAALVLLFVVLIGLFGTSATRRGEMGGDESAVDVGAARDAVEAVEAVLRPGASWQNALGMSFVWIPAGSYERGSPEDEAGRSDREALHPVVISKAFWLGSTPVTQEQWEAVMGSNPSQRQGARLPVEQVSWHDCQEFIRRLNLREQTERYRLPSEAEWEYACRAGTTGPRYGELGAIAWYRANSGHRSHPVSAKKPNSWGLYDMLGNVWEWCSDWFDVYPDGPVVDPRGPETGTYRVFRGGGWGCEAEHCRAAARSRWSPDHRYSNLGFRVAASSVD